MPDLTVAAETCQALGSVHRELEAYPNRELKLGDLAISRALPVKGRRLIGPWCFLDRYGPLSFTDSKPMDVAPHPHIGLQTVTWLLEGEVVHDDSLSSQAVLRPGGVNVMTSGNGISHAEQTPRDNSGQLNGVQLWVALPDGTRHGQPGFQHVLQVPTIELPGGIVRAFSGGLEGISNNVSPARHYSDLVGADLEIHAHEMLSIPLNPSFEHALLVLSGDCRLERQQLGANALYYLGSERGEASLQSTGGARVLLIGGPPFPETILMWWNFVARTPEEIRDARQDWEEHRRFGDVRAYQGQRLAAPTLVKLAQPNPVS
ncbi:MAG: pirin family protein [Candidatus Korobacteraceae bacterium]